jgi:nitrite reductase (NO-forming)
VTTARDLHGDRETSSKPRGAEGRIRVAQRQARATLRLAGGFAVAAAVALVVPHRTGDWLPLHLFLVGALLLAISAATQLFAVSWSAGAPPTDHLATMQRWLLAAGAASLATARELQWPSWLVAAGGALVITSLVVLGISLTRTVSRGVQRRFDGSLRSYLAALAAGLAGSALGIAMASGLDAVPYGRVRAAHLTLNLLGLVGLVIAGTLPFFTATQARVKMSARATGRAQDLVLAGLVGALGAATLGFLLARPVVAAVGLGAYAAGVLGSVVLVPRIGVRQLRWGGPRLLQLGAGVTWWVGASVVAAWRAGHGAVAFTPTVVGVLVVGGYAQILGAAVAYLGPVLRAAGHEQLTAGFRTTRSWLALGAANVAAIALLLGTSGVAVAAILVWVIDTSARVARLVAGPGARLCRRTPSAQDDRAPGRGRRIA